MDGGVYGFVLLVFAVGTYFSLVRAFDEYLIRPRVNQESWPRMRNGRDAKFLAAMVVVVREPPEVQCCHAFEEVLAGWDSGRRRAAIDRLNQLSTEIPPWEPDPYAEGGE